MEFGWINLCGLIVAAVLGISMLLVQQRRAKPWNWAETLRMVVFAAALVLLVLPVGIGEFGFISAAAMVLYLIGNAILLLLYIVITVLYLKLPPDSHTYTHGGSVTGILLLSGFAMEYWALIAAALVYTVLLLAGMVLDNRNNHSK